MTSSSSPLAKQIGEEDDVISTQAQLTNKVFTFCKGNPILACFETSSISTYNCQRPSAKLVRASLGLAPFIAKDKGLFEKGAPAWRRQGAPAPSLRALWKYF
jgi:hypothetical protein